MRLPGTRYQEPGWEQVRKLLGQCSLQALARCDVARVAGPGAQHGLLGEYVDLCAQNLRACFRSPRARSPGNSYGDSVLDLALTLLFELQERGADWETFCTAVAAEYQRLGPFWLGANGEGLLRKKVNDMYAVLRDKVDSDNYQAACGRPCSPNRIYAFRMLDTARGDIARLFDGWREHREQVGAILGRAVDAEPIEARQVRGGAGCKGEWVLRWSESLERFTGSPGPLHTRSKRFASLKNSPERIDAMLREIADYEEISANSDQDWLLEAEQATGWLEDYWRVLGESLEAATPGPDQILQAAQDEIDAAAPCSPEDVPAPEADSEFAALAGVSSPLRYTPMPRAVPDATPSGRLLAQESMPVRMAVYLKLLGPADDSYPDEWLDPATGELPTMQQLAAFEKVSLPTLRKRRDAAIDRLMALRR
jgi:hypothetical protein